MDRWRTIPGAGPPAREVERRSDGRSKPVPHPSRRGSTRSRWRAGVVLLAGVLVVVSIVWFVPLLHTIVPPSLAGNGPQSSGGGVPVACTVSASTPSADLDIYATAPTTTVPAGSSLQAMYELRAQSLPTGLSDVQVQMPSMAAVFSTSSSTPVTVYVSPQTLVVAAYAWTSPVGHARLLATSAAFTTASTAQLSSQLLAVMSSSA